MITQEEAVAAPDGGSLPTGRAIAEAEMPFRPVPVREGAAAALNVFISRHCGPHPRFLQMSTAEVARAAGLKTARARRWLDVCRSHGMVNVVGRTGSEITWALSDAFRQRWL